MNQFPSCGDKKQFDSVGAGWSEFTSRTHILRKSEKCSIDVILREDSVILLKRYRVRLPMSSGPGYLRVNPAGKPPGRRPEARADGSDSQPFQGFAPQDVGQRSLDTGAVAEQQNPCVPKRLARFTSCSTNTLRSQGRAPAPPTVRTPVPGAAGRDGWSVHPAGTRARPAPAARQFPRRRSPPPKALPADARRIRRGPSSPTPPRPACGRCHLPIASARDADARPVSTTSSTVAGSVVS